ncbi:MAG: hypothetical protein IIC76_14015 [Bacteroidetes bacterium]|nr:hypothetical protein [Bacteroidota bacterium]
MKLSYRKIRIKRNLILKETTFCSENELPRKNDILYLVIPDRPQSRHDMVAVARKPHDSFFCIIQGCYNNAKNTFNMNTEEKNKMITNGII